MKYLKFGPYEIGASAIILVSALLRILLAALGWPLTNSDEGTMGLMAMHIAYRGEHPLVFYGQTYMGSLEAYLGAISFHILGVSVFSLRLGVILLFTLFLVSMYLLTSLVFSKKLALVVLALLSLGSTPMLTREMIATGGSTQTLLFGSLAFLLASWLALSYQRTPAAGARIRRYLAYSGWGLVVGLGLWSDMIVVPFFFMAGLLLLLFCWRELWSLAPLFLLLGLLIGVAPLLYYNFDVLHYANSASILLGLFHGTAAQSPHSLHQILHNIQATIQVSVPMATGEPFCPVVELPWLGDNSPHTLACTVSHSVWGLGYLLLLLTALALTIGTLLKLRRQAPFRAPAEGSNESATLRRTIIQLVLLLTAAFDITLYAFSSAPVDMPGFHARYLIGLLIITPAMLSPLWDGFRSGIQSPARAAQVRTITGRLVLALIFMALLAGTLRAFSEAPAAQASNQRDEALISDLLRTHVSHIYTEYWTCDKIAFMSQERITCAVLNNDLQMDVLHNRYTPYITLVQADPHAAYVCPIGFAPAAAMLQHLEQKASKPGAHYRRSVFAGYLVLQPA